MPGFACARARLGTINDLLASAKVAHETAKQLAAKTPAGALIFLLCVIERRGKGKKSSQISCCLSVAALTTLTNEA